MSTSGKYSNARASEISVLEANMDSRLYLLWVFLAPSLLIYRIVVVYPMVDSAYLSLFRWDGVSPTKVFVGLQNELILLTQNDVF